MDLDAVAELDATFVSAMRVSVAEGTHDPTEGDATYEHTAADAGLEDYAHELAFLPGLTETSPTTLDSQRRMYGVTSTPATNKIAWWQC
ncbi:hypothetical protein PI124_g23836 [Phytophthora idaei]|nr:hypothetical protein PI125_g26095 [Phytophthora idaei]KAG3123000.1 hypothetical protein PI126_g23898 [Phytophthora idaei]KAG3231070.1 hypothetical protein PI124_g23836 [Phytophthora idaei]